MQQLKELLKIVARFCPSVFGWLKHQLLQYYGNSVSTFANEIYLSTDSLDTRPNSMAPPFW